VHIREVGFRPNFWDRPGLKALSGLDNNADNCAGLVTRVSTEVDFGLPAEDGIFDEIHGSAPRRVCATGPLADPGRVYTKGA